MNKSSSYVRLLIFFTFIACGTPSLLHAQGIRFSSQVTQANTTVSAAATLVDIPPNPSIQFCNAPANSVPCSNLATTYTDASLGTACSTATQIVLDGTNTCVSLPDQQNNWGVWAAPGQYAYTVMIPGVGNFGPYYVTLSSGSLSSIALNGSAQPFEPQLNLVPGTNQSITCTDTSMVSTNCTFAPGSAISVKPVVGEFVRYVSSLGSDSTGDGRSLGTAYATVYKAVTDLDNNVSTAGGGGFVYLYGPNGGGVRCNTFGTVYGDFESPGCWIIGGTDKNYLTTSAASQTDGTVTLTTSNAVPSSIWYNGTMNISVFFCADKTYDGVYTPTLISGSTITYSQNTTNGSTSGCVVVPNGWLPTKDGIQIIGVSGLGGDGTGGVGPPIPIVGGNQYDPINIVSISESGNTVSVVLALASGTVGMPFRIYGTVNYDGVWQIATIVGTTITFTDSTGSLGSETVGQIQAEVPSFWITGTGNAPATVTNLSFNGPLPNLTGIDSDVKLDTVQAISGLHFVADQWNANPGSQNNLNGPAVWIGSNTLWDYMDYNTFQSNPFAPVNSDQRSAVLMKSLPGGSTSGLVKVFHGNSNGGGGFRFYQQSGSSSVNIDGWLEEGTTQTQPVFEEMSTTGSVYAKMSDLGLSDSGDNPPFVRVPLGFAAGNSSVVVNTQASPGTSRLTGPMTIVGGESANVTTGAWTSTAPEMSDQAQGMVGLSAGSAINLDTNVARRNFSPVNVRFANSALAPGSWTTETGTGVMVTGGQPDPLGGSNATEVSCSANNGMGYCGVYAFNSSHAFGYGDYILLDEWIAPVQHDTGYYQGFYGAMKLTGPTLSTTEFYAPYSGGTGNVAGNIGDDGQWRHIYAWYKTSAATTVSTKLELNFTANQPVLVYGVRISFISGSQLVPPTASTLSEGSGGALGQTTYYVRTTYVNANGESIGQATNATLTVDPSNYLSVTSPGAESGATGWNLYVGDSQTCVPITTTGLGVITAISEIGNVVSVTASSGTPEIGYPVVIGGIGTSGYNGTWTVNSVSGHNFTYTDTNTGLVTDSGGGSWNLQARKDDATGPGEQCEIRQNASPIAIGTPWTQAGALTAYSSWYDGANTGAGRTEPTVDTTNAYGNSEIGDYILSLSSFNQNCSVGETCNMNGPVLIPKPFLTTAYTNSTVTASTILSVHADASTKYTIHCHGLYQAAASGYFGLTIAGPSSPTLVTYDFNVGTAVTSNAVTYLDYVGTGSSYPSGIGETPVTTAAADMPWDIQIGFTNGTTAGTLAVQGLTVVSDTLTVEAGSFCTAQ